MLCDGTSPRRVAIFFSPLGIRGRERLLLSIARRLLAQGHQTDFLTASSAPWMQEVLPPNARLIDLGRWWMGRDANGRYSKRRTYLSVLPLGLYMRRQRPDVVLAASIPPAISALTARKLLRCPVPVVIRQSNTLHVPSDPQYAQIRARPRDRRVRKLYPEAQTVIAVSKGVAENIVRATGLPAHRTVTVPHGIDLAMLGAAAAEPPSHRWFRDRSAPLIVNVARMVPKKDQATLLRAFARVLRQRPAKLVIFGSDGGEYERLQSLAHALDIDGHVDFAGFEPNPFAHLARADLFVLSSISEGMPSAPIEALACGCPVVCTDYQSGAREILDEGHYGPVVPVGDDASLAEAIIRTLDAPLPRSVLKDRAKAFGIEKAAAAYADVLLRAASGQASMNGACSPLR